MIIVRLTGGLGNQMFQYAFGKFLSRKHNTALKIDTSYFKEHKLRKYELGVFNIEETFASGAEKEEFFPQEASVSTKLRSKLKSKLLGYKVISEKGFEFFPTTIQEAGANAYLSGYWQTEKYFTGIEKEIRDCFKFRFLPDADNAKMLKDITGSNSVSIHIRRGDYVTDAHTNTVHGVCGLDYYKRAVEYISKQVEKPVFFIFSDDVQWVKENLRLESEHYFLDHNQEKGEEDMRLMMNCKHNIIANSSFSWWAAWLNKNEKKIIIAPEKWFNDSTINTKDIIPASWLKM